jgi:peptidoglycan/LPS O-acetylase OafA/YrhL
MQHIKTLDVVRTFAVFFVILEHWQFQYIHAPTGALGVKIFFVLSGYLITNSLWQTKQADIYKYLSTFYIKRSFRIFPIYYLYLLLFGGFFLFAKNFFVQIPVFAEGFDTFQKYFWYLLTYTYNFQEMVGGFVFNQHFLNSRFFGHLWSLCIEEQFYLVFPFMVYFLPKKYLIVFCAIVVLASPFLRILLTKFLLQKTDHEFLVYVTIHNFTPLQIDVFFIGALLYFAKFTFSKTNSIYIFGNLCNILGFLSRFQQCAFTRIL